MPYLSYSHLVKTKGSDKTWTKILNSILSHKKSLILSKEWGLKIVLSTKLSSGQKRTPLFSAKDSPSSFTVNVR